MLQSSRREKCESFKTDDTLQRISAYALASLCVSVKASLTASRGAQREDFFLSESFAEKKKKKTMIKEFHLFAGIGGGIYAGELLGHKCCGGVEIMEYAQRVLKQRQKDGWMNKFPIYNDLCKLNGSDFKNKFDILCGGFPCQAFSSAAHGKNIPEKDLWEEMFRFVKESDAPIVFAENVALRAINKAKEDLESIGYKVERIRLSNADIGADHQRHRFWLLAVKDLKKLDKIVQNLIERPKITGNVWVANPNEIDQYEADEDERTNQLLGVGNAQSPLVAASAFRILVNRHINTFQTSDEHASEKEIEDVFEKKSTWIRKTYGENFGMVHTPTTVANYCCKSMQKHPSCRNYIQVFCPNERKPMPLHCEYLMGFPIGASNPNPLPIDNFIKWRDA